jgi:2-polyprenyl-6-methoxyphenol hydroxylase-like FAD-dependent oxidoreductase
MRAKDDSCRTEVLIVGGGPVGMLLALFLDRHGVKSVVLNSDNGVPTHPRGSTHNSRTMEHYRRLGISGAIRKLGLPPDHTKDAAYFTRLSGWEIARYRMPSEIELAHLIAAAQVTDQIPEPTQRADQIRVADFLLKHVSKRSNVKLRFGWQADQFSQDADGVALTARRVTDGESEQ